MNANLPLEEGFSFMALAEAIDRSSHNYAEVVFHSYLLAIRRKLCLFKQCPQGAFKKK